MSKLSRSDTPGPSLKIGRAEVGGRMGERRGEGCVMVLGGMDAPDSNRCGKVLT